MRKKTLLSMILSATMFLNVVSTTAAVYAEENGQFKNPLNTIEKSEYSTEKFTAKPLVILMDFPDYKYTELDEREKDFRINSFTGKESTPELYNSLFFGDDTYKTSDGKEHITVNKFFKEESGGTYEFKGKVYGWYTADHNAAYYGGTQGDAAKLVREAINKVVENNPDLDLSQFDVEDKWDIDHDGNYNEPDGILDTVVVLHAGMGEEWGGGSLGEDAIWPFRIGFSWYNYELDLEKEGEKLVQKDEKGNYPAYNFKDGKGKEWFAEDFTIFEQDLPVDLFNHEYGHVLGLPDLYGDEPPVENWSIMGGSYTGNPRGSQPVSYGAWCKQYLQEDFAKRGRNSNWQKQSTLNLDEIDENGMDIVLDQASLKGKNKDSIRINLPEAEGERVVTPPEGTNCYFSGRADNLKNYMTTKEAINIGDAKAPKLTFKTWYGIDPGFDFASVQVREVGTEKWIAIQDETGLTTDKVDPWIESDNPDSILERNPGWGITGSSNKKWLDASFDLSKFKGKKIEFRFRFRTDSNTPEDVIYIDDIKINDGTTNIFKDNAETESKFNFDGFEKNDGKDKPYNHYYMLEWRSSGAETLVDKGLQTINVKRPTLEYDPGLLVWYINEKYDGSVKDQSVLNHPGKLFAGIVDADQNPITYEYVNGEKGTSGINYQMHDAAFSLRPGSNLNMNVGSGENAYSVKDKNTFMNPMFNDSNDYTASHYNPASGLILKNYGLKIFVTEESKDRSTAKIHIAKEKDGSKSTTQEQDLIKMVKAENGKLFVTPTAQYGEKAYAEYVNSKNEKKQVTLEYKDGKYVADATFLSGKNDWKMSHIIFIDAAGNAKAIYNKEVHKIFGADLSATGEMSSIKVQVSNKDSEFVKGTTVNVKADVKINKADSSNAKIEKVKLLVGVYDANDKLISFAVKEATVGTDGVTPLNADIKIPNQDKLRVKVFLWESSPLLRSLGKSTTFMVK